MQRKVSFTARVRDGASPDDVKSTREERAKNLPEAQPGCAEGQLAAEAISERQTPRGEAFLDRAGGGEEAETLSDRRKVVLPLDRQYSQLRW